MGFIFSLHSLFRLWNAVLIAGNDSREDDRCLVLPHVCPSHTALSVGDVGRRSAGLLNDLDVGKWSRSVLGIKIYPFLELYSIMFLVDSANHDILSMCCYRRQA